MVGLVGIWFMLMVLVKIVVISRLILFGGYVCWRVGLVCMVVREIIKVGVKLVDYWW